MSSNNSNAARTLDSQEQRLRVVSSNPASQVSDAEAMSQVLEATTSARTLEDAVQRALNTVKEAFGWAYGSYWEVNPEAKVLEFRLEAGSVNDRFRKATLETRFRPGQGLSGRVWDSKDLFFVKDLGSMTDCPRQKPAQEAGVKSGVGIPILRDGEVIGVMDFFTLETLEPTQERLDVLRSVGRMVSGALERLAETQKQEMITKNAIALTEVAFATSSATSVHEAAKATLERVKEIFGWAYASYWVLDPAENKLKFMVESGQVNEAFRRATLETKFSLGQGLSGRAWERKDLHFVEDLGTVNDCPRREPAVAAGVKSGVAFPIMVNGNVIGVMDFFMLQKIQLPKERAETLRNVGRLASNIIGKIEEGERQLREKLRMADDFEKTVGSIVQVVSSSATEMSASSSTLVTGASQTASQSQSVAAASEEATTSVQSVASAAEEMSASIKEVSKNVTQSASIAKQAAKDAEAANALMIQLGDSSQEIGQVVKVITSIAQQTNLLALNATIEAARAGEAGKGFAVVANEVKELARQTAKATEEIGQKISSVQKSSELAVKSIQAISGVISELNQTSVTISSAVEEQSATTAEIARAATEAARGTAEVNRNISDVSKVATESKRMAGDIQTASLDLSKQAESLRLAVETFLKQVRG